MPGSTLPFESRAYPGRRLARGAGPILRVLAGLLLLGACGGRATQDAGGGGAGGPARPVTLRVGHFPNITHVHGLVAHRLSRQGQGWFESRLGPGVHIEWYVYNAGPSAMEAMLAGSLELSYVGPNPALNAHMRSRGREIRVIAGATLGGSGLVVPGGGSIRGPLDLKGKRVATPQLGNTQDVACRSWLRASGLVVTQTGGDVRVVPTANPDQLLLFRQGQVAAVWTVEPWLTRLELEAQGEVLVAEADAVTTLLVASAAFLERSGPLARRFVEAHQELTRWIQEDPERALGLVRQEIEAETRIGVPAELAARAWQRMRVDAALPATGIRRIVDATREAGFLAEPIDLDRLLVAP